MDILYIYLLQKLDLLMEEIKINNVYFNLFQLCKMFIVFLL